MADDPFANLENAVLLESLRLEEKEELRVRHYVQSGEYVIWIEPEGRVRREQYANLYYIRTGKGIFRTSRISKEIVEV